MAGRFPQGGYTDFVGRRDELDQIGAMLADRRLVTIAGPGGVGKTRVALVAAAQAAARYPDGPWIVELSGLRDPALLPNTVASVLGLPEQDARTALDAVLEYLRERRLLLILDTCEHLLDACAALVQAVLRYAPGVTVLATSRQPLDTAGEHIFQIGPLPVRDAVELFGLRAALAMPGFTVSEENAADVSRLCRRLDGVPLAIELAAVQLRALPLPELVRRLDQRFAVLSIDRPGALPRHQTLRTAIEWSYELCSAPEQRLWARLSVFAGTFSLTAAEEVCAEVSLERADVIRALIGLVDKSVVLREGERYLMLDTLREFGAERLAESGELASCQARHIARYRAIARRFGAHFADDDQMDCYHRLRVGHANLRAALTYALDLEPEATPPAGPAGVLGQASGPFQTVAPAAARERWRAGADLACSLYGYWQISGLLGEGGYWLSKALDRFPETGPERARALVNRGFLRSFQGDAGGALADCETGTEMARALGDDAVTARGYQHTMLTLVFLGRHDEALKAAEEARVRLRACGDRAGELMLMAQLGHLHQLAGRPAESVAVCAEGLEMLGAGSGEQWIRSYLYTVSGFALFSVPGREADCEAALREGLRGKLELGDIIGIAYALDVLGWAAMKTGSAARSAWLLGAAEPLWERGGSIRFSGTAIMADMHEQAVGQARAALGAAGYDEEYARGARYVRHQLDASAAGGGLRLELP
ncbi:MAG TPA: NB-ARC domain-containing protein [Trebonia sp.]|nr:NB-ARC domain-containing protein [Trebonia sp.]